MTVTKPLLLTSLVLFGILLPSLVRAQIASPVNAGMNSGNNGFGSSPTSIGTPNFTEGQSLIMVPGLSLEPDGSIIAPPELLSMVQNAIGTISVVNQSDTNTLRLLVNAEADTNLNNSQVQAAISEIINQLIASGLDSLTASELTTSMVGLANQTTLNKLDKAIKIFNNLLSAASPQLRATLKSNLTFTEISKTLRTARQALDR